MTSKKHTSCNEGTCKGLCCTKIEDFGVTFGNNEILKDVNLHMHCGELTAIIGPNGAGKSTLLKAILGEVKHTGNLKFMAEKGDNTRKPLIGYVPQSLKLDSGAPTSVLDLFMACRTSFPTWLGVPKRMKSEVEKSLIKVKAEHLIDRRLGALSGGELQRVLLALALDPIPQLLLLDEPVSGIDKSGKELFYKMVSKIRKDYDLSIILISHDLDMVYKYADRVVLLNETVLASGTPDEVYSKKAFSNIFGMNWVKKTVEEE